MKRLEGVGPNPSGLCMCGCGKPAPIATMSNTKLGVVKGQPRRFIHNHQLITTTGKLGPNPSGLCMCGCGQLTDLAKVTATRRGHIKGKPMQYVSSHHIIKYVPLVERFWEKIDKQGPLPSAKSVQVWPDIAGTRCWEWTGSLSTSGRGQIEIEGIAKNASRIAWFLETGVLPKQEACHKCDNPKCVRFSHLFDGSHLQNMQDMAAKGRANPTKGEQHVNSKLTELKVRSIRRSISQGSTNALLANKYKVCRSTIQSIKTSRTWKEAA